MSVKVVSAGMGGKFSMVFKGTKILKVDNEANMDTTMIRIDHQRRHTTEAASNTSDKMSMGMKPNTMNGAGKKLLGSILPAWAQAIMMTAMTITMISNMPKRRFFFRRLFRS